MTTVINETGHSRRSLLCAVPATSPPLSPTLPPSPPPLPPLSPPVSPPSQPSASTPSLAIFLSVFVGIALTVLAFMLYYHYWHLPRGLRLLHEHTNREEGLDADTRRRPFLGAAPAAEQGGTCEIVPDGHTSSTASRNARARRSRSFLSARVAQQLKSLGRRLQRHRKQRDTQQELIVAVAASSAVAVANSSTAMHVASGVRSLQLASVPLASVPLTSIPTATTPGPGLALSARCA